MIIRDDLVGNKWSHILQECEFDISCQYKNLFNGKSYKFLVSNI